MIPNKAAIFGTGVAVSGVLGWLYATLHRRQVRSGVIVVTAATACAVGAVVFDLCVILLMRGPEALAWSSAGSVSALIDGIPVPGRVGNYATLLAAWSLAWHLFARVPVPVRSPTPTPDAVASLESSLTVSGSTIRVRDAARVILFDATEVEWISADGDYLRIHGGARPPLIRGTMKQAAHALAPLGFVRVHRSAIVNAACLREVVRSTTGEVTLLLRSGVRVKAGRTYLAAVRHLTRR